MRTDVSNERRFLQLLNEIDGLVWEADSSADRLSFVSAKAAELLGYPERDWLDERGFFERRIHPDDREQAMTELRAAGLEGGVRRFLHRMIAADGRVLWFRTEVHGVVDEGGPVRGLVGLSLDFSERMRATEALRESEAWYRLLLEQMPLVFWTTDRQLRFTYAMGAGLRRLGLKGNVLAGIPVAEYMRTDDPKDPRLAPSLRALAGEASSFVMDWEGRWYHLHVEPFRDASGAIIGTIGVGLDITERHRAQQALEISEARIRTLLDASPEPIFFKDGEGRWQEVNEAAIRLFEFEELDYRGKTDLELAALRPRYAEALRTCNQTDQLAWQKRELSLLEEVIPGPGGGSRIIETYKVPLFYADGRRKGLVVLGRDITARKRAEAERDRLFEAEQRARAAAEAAEQRAVFLAEASRILASSLDYEATLRQVAQLAVPTVADLCVVYTDGDGQIAATALARGPEVGPAEEDTIAEVLAEPAPCTGVAEVMQVGASHLVVDLARPIPGEGEWAAMQRGKLVSLSLVSLMSVPLIARQRKLGALLLASARPDRRYAAADLTLAEDLARRAALAVDNARLYHEAQEAIRARSEFLSIASHELRTPSTSLMLGVQSLLKLARTASLERASPETLRRILETCDRQSQKLAKLIGRLLDVSRIQAGQLDLELDEVDLSALVRDVAGAMRDEARQAGSTITVQADAEVVGWLDRSRIEQVVTNLVGNAIKYGAGRPITVCVERAGDAARISVRDQGIGIDPQQQKQVFERFERAVSSRHYGGLGLGLYIVREIVEAHGGRVSLESAPGAGSKFIVELPVAARGAQAASNLRRAG